MKCVDAGKLLSCSHPLFVFSQLIAFLHLAIFLLSLSPAGVVASKTFFFCERSSPVSLHPRSPLLTRVKYNCSE